MRLLSAEVWKGLTPAEQAESGIIKSETAGPEELDAIDHVERLEKAGADPASERVIAWTVSTETRDRDGDVIKQAGIDIKDYRKNPVVLYAHDYRSLPIGIALDTWIDKGGKGGPRLRMLKKFTAQDENPFGFMVYRLASAGYLKAASIGFMPTKFDQDPDSPEGKFGLRFDAVKLLESSIVPVPSNPGALQEAKSAHGIDIAPLAAWAEQILDEAELAGLPVKRKTIEVVREISRPTAAPMVFEVPSTEWKPSDVKVALVGLIKRSK